MRKSKHKQRRLITSSTSLIVHRNWAVALRGVYVSLGRKKSFEMGVSVGADVRTMSNTLDHLSLCNLYTIIICGSTFPLAPDTDVTFLATF